MRASQKLALTGALLLSATACTGSAPEGKTPPGAAPAAGPVSEADRHTRIAIPQAAGKGGIAGVVPAEARPTKAPAQAAGELAGQALPTNQWWTSALTGPLSQQMWAHPLALAAKPAGLQVSSAPPSASANAVVTPFIPAITAGGRIKALTVVGYGAFHVALRAQFTAGGAVEATLVQGSPLLYLRFADVAPSFVVTGEVQQEPGGDPSVVRLSIAGQRWDLVAEQGARWRLAGDQLTTSGGAGQRDTAGGAGFERVAVARVPDKVDAAAWDAALAGAAADPVQSTTARMAYDPATGTVTQTLSAVRASGRPGIWALLPHQRAFLVKDGSHDVAGSYPDALGKLSLVRSDSLRVRVPMPGLLTAAPSVSLPAAARTAVLAELDRDLADPPGTGGSYFGLKELGRLATIAEVAQGIGAEAEQRTALERLRPQLVDWLTYSGTADGRYFAYDKTWGGLIAVPAEFGSSDYNDHHFQYGYLIRAAAILGQADPGFLGDYGAVVDLVARDYGGALGSGGAAGFPAFRTFNAYLGHSASSGFAQFADGNNQESSSEAVAGWEALVRWGLVRGNAELVQHGVTHYALESATARMYWLGEGITRPAGYAHTGVGIVWDGKTDYATWFDPRPESVQGIQLLPLTFGSLYRADPTAAAARAARLTKEVGGPPRVWGDLFAADLALADPAAALRRLTPNLPRESSTSRALVRYWVEILAALGPPQPAQTADGPYGLAFGSREHPTLVAVNPTGRARQVTFRANGTVTATVSVAPGRSATQRP